QRLLQSHHIRGVQKILREGGVEDVKRIGKAEEAGRQQQGVARQSASPAAAEGPRQLSAVQMSALRAVMTELEAVKAILVGTREAEAGAQRSRRTAARG